MLTHYKRELEQVGTKLTVTIVVNIQRYFFQNKQFKKIIRKHTQLNCLTRRDSPGHDRPSTTLHC